MNLRKPILNQRANTIDNNYNYEKNKNRNQNFKRSNPLSKSIDVMIYNKNKNNSNINSNNIFNRFEDRIDYQMKYNDIDKGLFFGSPRSTLKNK